MNVVVTGASKGIGRAIAEIFAGGGHQLFICARGEMELYHTVEELQTRYPVAGIHGMAADLSDPEAVKKFAGWIMHGDRSADVLVNNAGRFIPGSIHEEPEGALEEMMRTNVYSAYQLTRLLLPGMMVKKSGHIFNLCSVASLEAYTGGGSYSISKFALHGFSKNLREEMKPFGVKVTSVFPGAVYTDSWSGSGVSADRIMTAADVAKLVFTAAHLSPQACVEDIVLRPQLGDL